jgi:nucleotide-binding universal stress UspA family protein
MIKRLLVAIDGSPSALAALSIAGSLGGIIQAEVIGLYVENVGRFENLSGAELETAEREVEEESRDLRKAFQARCQSAKVQGRFLSLRGIPDDIIRERAKTVDFVIIGNSGTHRGTPERHSGETVSALLKSVARPVLVVPEDVAGESKMVVAYDGTLPSDRALRAAAEFAQISEIESVHLLTATGTTEECQTIQAPALDYLSAFDFHVTPVCLTGQPGEAILAYIEEVDASILALGAFGPNRLRESVFGSTTDAVLKQGQAAVLLVS